MELKKELLSLNEIKIHANAQTIFDETVKIYEENNLKIEELISITTDCCNTMIGSSNGFVRKSN